MIENLRMISELGIRALLKQQREKYTCTVCGGTICIHRGYCMTCHKIHSTHAGTIKAQEVLRRNLRKADRHAAKSRR
jgi:competence CoiA-like predicted nuclease